MQRVYSSSKSFQISNGDPIRSVVLETEHCVVVAWHVQKGQSIPPHTHPDGQDTWTILSGAGEYQTDSLGNTTPITAGDVVIAKRGEVHGVRGTSELPLTFISVVAPKDAGYTPLS